MNRFSCLKIARCKARRLKGRNCRNLLVPSRVRRQVMAERLDKIWLELRQHTTIEMDPRKLWRVSTDLEKNSQLAGADPQHNEI